MNPAPFHKIGIIIIIFINSKTKTVRDEFIIINLKYEVISTWLYRVPVCLTNYRFGYITIRAIIHSVNPVMELTSV